MHTHIPEKMEAGPVEAVIVLQPGQVKREAGADEHASPSNQKRLMDCVRELRKLGPIVGMDDPHCLAAFHPRRPVITQIEVLGFSQLTDVQRERLRRHRIGP